MFGIDDPELVVSLVAVAVSLVAVGISILSQVRASRADKRAKQAEQFAARQEAIDRATEARFALLALGNKIDSLIEHAAQLKSRVDGLDESDSVHFVEGMAGWQSDLAQHRAETRDNAALLNELVESLLANKEADPRDLLDEASSFRNLILTIEHGLDTYPPKFGELDEFLSAKEDERMQRVRSSIAEQFGSLPRRMQEDEDR